MLAKIIFIAMTVACLATAILSAYVFTIRVASAEQAHQIDDVVRNLQIALLDAETGQRGYLITGDPGYLAPYESGARLSKVRLQELQAATDKTPQQVTTTRIAALTEQKLDELARVVVSRDQPNGFAIAEEQVKSHLGKNLMDTIRENIDQVQLWAIASYQTNKDQAVVLGRIVLFTIMSAFCLGFMSLRTEKV